MGNLSVSISFRHGCGSGDTVAYLKDGEIVAPATASRDLVRVNSGRLFGGAVAV